MAVDKGKREPLSFSIWMIEGLYFFVKEVSRVIHEIREYDTDVCFEIGKRIQDLRHLKEMKAVELASYLNIEKNQMSRIERGKANCTVPQ